MKGGKVFKPIRATKDKEAPNRKGAAGLKFCNKIPAIKLDGRAEMPMAVLKRP